VRRDLGEVDLAVAEEVAQEVHVARGIGEPFADDPSGQAFDEGGTEGLVASLPLGGGVEEVGGVWHKTLYNMAVT